MRPFWLMGLTSLLLPASVVIAADNGMVSIEQGIYRPLYLSETSPMTEVDAFKIDKKPVTNAQYYAFVIQHKGWEKQAVSPLFSEASYLKHWQIIDQQYVPKMEDLDKPVTYVSWFAAQAYCEAQGKQLPTVAQWEYVAQASESQIQGSQEAGYTQRILDWYATSATKPLANVAQNPANYWGLYDLHGLIWEWTYDFNSALVTGESRSDSSLNQQMFCGSGAAGAADPSDYAAFMRYGFRASLQAPYALAQLGFRCAQ
ncbi:formylglycine-generating enzyme family protein [Pseudomonas sp. F1_0610]|uniref:formylglycine-generating enzyme family protein n=1 Tax=Pseudomonas sp. F1_0610 TaxID=3114284 RepID=UPI0039C104AE